jgi:hypothetical protein
MFHNLINMAKEKTKVLENAVMNYEDEEVWVREATSAQISLAPTSLMQRIAESTNRMDKCAVIMNAIWERLRDVSSVKHVYKALHLIEYLIKNGSERVVVESRKRIVDIRQFTRYTIRNVKNQEVGGEVRQKANTIVDLLHDKKRLKEERKKCQQTRGKYSNSVTNEDVGFRSRGFNRSGGSGGSGFNRDRSTNNQPTIDDEWDYDSSESSNADEKGDTSGFTFTQTDEKEDFDGSFSDEEDPFGDFEFGGPPTSKSTLVTGTTNQGTGIFGGSSQGSQGGNQGNQNIFGGTSQGGNQGGSQGNQNIFGGSSQGGNQGGNQNIFGGPNQGGNQGGNQGNQNIFGGPSQGGNQGGNQNQNIFGGSSQGGNQGGNQNIFGGPSQGGNQGGNQNIFGGPSQGGNQGGSQGNQNIFGGPNQGGSQGGSQGNQSIFGGPSSQGSQGNQSIFGGPDSQGSQGSQGNTQSNSGGSNPKDPWANFKFDLEGISNPNKQTGIPLGQTFNQNQNPNSGNMFSTQSFGHTNTSNNFGFL